jgi:hypothetical protein
LIKNASASRRRRFLRLDIFTRMYYNEGIKIIQGDFGMNEKNYTAPKSNIIYFLESDLISVSGSPGTDPDLGEWDTEM